MHHTFNPNTIIIESRAQVTRPDVRLTTDSLFYEGKRVPCNYNRIAWNQIQTCLGVPAPQVNPDIYERCVASCISALLMLSFCNFSPCSVESWTVSMILHLMDRSRWGLQLSAFLFPGVQKHKKLIIILSFIAVGIYVVADVSKKTKGSCSLLKTAEVQMNPSATINISATGQQFAHLPSTCSWCL